MIPAATTFTTLTFPKHLSPRRLPPLILIPFLKTLTCNHSLITTSPRHSPLSVPPMSSNVVAEYAKSKRSSCKTCSKTIDANALRLGVVTKDKQRGFDMTRWHHFQCLSFNSLSLESAESISGFNSLKNDDQEALTKLVEDCEKVKDGDKDAAAGDKPKKGKKRKNTDKAEELNTVEKKPEKSQLTVRDGAKFDVALEVSDIKDTYKDASLPSKWRAFHTIIFLEKDDGLQDSSKIAAFDFDGCLAKTSVKRTGADAWSLMFKSIPEKLEQFYNNGYKLVIFTNESNIDRWKNKRQVAVDSKVGRLNNFIKHVKVPIQVFIACGFDDNKAGTEDPYRKPQSGMWHVMEKHFNSGITIDMDNSFYVGDAAGRENDHSDADIKFAEAVGLKFHVPEEFF